jgi:hypothetical protein
MSVDRPISHQEVAVLLSSALGQDKSIEVVATAARELGISQLGALDGEEVRAIFNRLVIAEGLVGVVARFAVSRGDVDKLIARAPVSERHPRAPSRLAHAASGEGEGAAKPSVDIVHLIAPALGAEKAREAIETAATRRGISLAKGLSQDDALTVLDEMTKVEGIVGVVARFAKARFLLDPNS